LAEVKAVQKARGWDFTRAWSHVMAEQPAFARSSSTKVDGREADRSYARIEAAAKRLVAESGGRLTMGEALRRARSECPEVVKPAEIKAVEPKPKPRMLLIRGSEGTYVD
jgi:hypothetical protein